ncbi:ABC transporter substrate-binding protein [Paenibacillus fonticola]|uniref:ABC transporter substrate-binding protein n=1 Tax=Paenibacillus fonticola TaxID=379896 RepID=UPI00036390A4|nr:extracellular solute-binding protein [Paenibacillus fonticola]
MKWLLNWGWMLLYTTVLAVSVIIITAGNRDPIEENQSEKITLTFRHFWIKEHDRPMLNIFEDVVSEYQNAHPNVKVNFEGMDQTTHREQKLKSEMVTGTPPDMFVLFGGAEIEPYVRANRLMDLSQFVKNRGLKAKYRDLQLWTFDKRVYGLPIEGNAEPLYYNKMIFNELGLKEPSTLSELDHVISVLRDNGYIPFALGNEDRWPAAIFAHYLMDRYAGPELIQALSHGDDNYDFRNEKYLQAYEHLDRWAKSGAFAASANGYSTEEAIAQFTSGKAAMYLNGNWDINLFHRNEKDTKSATSFQDEVGVIPFPVLRQGETKSIAGGYTIGIGLSSNLEDAKKEAALDLLEYFYTEEVQSRIVYEGLRLPSIKISFDPERTGPVFAQVITLMEKSTQSFVPYDNVLSPEVKRSFLKGLKEMIGGQLDAGEALEELQLSSELYWDLRSSSLPFKNSGGAVNELDGSEVQSNSGR